MVSSKVDLGFNRIARLRDLDELAAVLFPQNRNHQRVFLVVFVELKWAENHFLATLESLADRNGFSRRTLETVRAKMRRLGLIDHVSRFNKKYGYREGWVLSNRFGQSLARLTANVAELKERRGGAQEQKDRQSWRFL